MNPDRIDTPALLLDLEALDRNIQRMGNYFRGRKASLRPHVKVHKSPFIAHKQLRAGAKGITCAKVSEAEVMAQSGIDDILVANEIVGDDKLRRLARLARECRILVTVDDIENGRQLSLAASQEEATIGVLVDTNLSSGLAGILDRCGVPAGPTAAKLCSQISELKNLEFKGLMGYEGGLRKFPEFAARKLAAQSALARLIETKEMVEGNGLDVQIVSCGGTMSYNIAGELPGITEVQAGSYVFMDATYQKFGLDFETALTVLATVISRPRPEKIIIDTGLKAISADSGLPLVKEKTELECIGLNAEHGHIKAQSEIDVHTGQQLELIPTHVDTTVCLHDNYLMTRGDEAIGTLEIPGRGKLQ